MYENENVTTTENEKKGLGKVGKWIVVGAAVAVGTIAGLVIHSKKKQRKLALDGERDEIVNTDYEIVDND